MVGKSARLQVILQQSTQKHIKFAITDIRKKPVNFFSCSTRALTLTSAITLIAQVPLQKFPFFLISIIPWYTHTTQVELLFTEEHNFYVRWK